MTRCDDATEAPLPPPPLAPARLARADRSRLLAIADDLGTAAPAAHYAVAHVAMGDVARAAGVTRTALYRLWPSRQDLWDELVDHALATPLVRRVPDVESGAVAGRAIDAAQDLLLGDPLPLLRTAVVGHPRRLDEVALLAVQRDETVTTLQAGVSAHLVGRRRPFPGVTTTDLAVMITMVGNGLPLTARLAGPEALHLVLGPEGRQRSLLAVLTGALVARLTEPQPEGAGSGPSLRGVPAPPPPWPTRRGGRRAHYLAVATDLALHPGPGGLDQVLGQVTLDGLARAAGVSRRTLTNVWPDRTAFRLDLFSHLLARERGWLLDAIATAADRIEAGHDPRAALLGLGDALEGEIGAALLRPSSLAFAPHLDTDPLAERARRDHDVLVGRCARAVRRLLSAAGRRLRPGVSLRTATLALTTLADGANRLARTRPELLGDGVVVDDERHTLTGAAVAVVLDDLTEPLDTRGPVLDLARLRA